MKSCQKCCYITLIRLCYIIIGALEAIRVIRKHVESRYCEHFFPLQNVKIVFSILNDFIKQSKIQNQNIN